MWIEEHRLSGRPRPLARFRVVRLIRIALLLNDSEDLIHKSIYVLTLCGGQILAGTNGIHTYGVQVFLFGLLSQVSDPTLGLLTAASGVEVDKDADEFGTGPGLERGGP